MSYSPDARLIAGMLDALIKKVDKTNELLQILIEQHPGLNSHQITNVVESIEIPVATSPQSDPVIPKIEEKREKIPVPTREIEKESISPTPPLKEKDKENIFTPPSPPELFPTLLSVKSNVTGDLPSIVPIELSDKIMEHLNLRTGGRFRSVPTYRKMIKKRVKEGYILDDFIRVIDTMTEAWGKDERMKPYLRPATLFSEKFQSYLDWRPDGKRNSQIGGNTNGRYVENTVHKSKYAGIEEVIEI